MLIAAAASKSIAVSAADPFPLLDELHVRYQIELEHWASAPGSNIEVLDATLFDGGIAAVDRARRRVMLYDSELNWLREWGVGGTGEGQLNQPSAIAVGRDGVFWILDRVDATSGWKISRFSDAGVWLGDAQGSEDLTYLLDIEPAADRTPGGVWLLGVTSTTGDYVVVHLGPEGRELDRWPAPEVKGEQESVSRASIAVLGDERIVVAGPAGLLAYRNDGESLGTWPAEGSDLAGDLPLSDVIVLPDGSWVVHSTEGGTWGMLWHMAADGSEIRSMPCEVHVALPSGFESRQGCQALSRLSDDQVLVRGHSTSSVMSLTDMPQAHDLNELRTGFAELLTGTLKPPGLRLDPFGGVWMCCLESSRGIERLRRWTPDGVPDTEEIEMSSSRRGIMEILNAASNGDILATTAEISGNSASFDSIRLERYGLDGSYRGQYPFRESPRDATRLRYALDVDEDTVFAFGYAPGGGARNGRFLNRGGIVATCCPSGDADGEVGYVADVARTMRSTVLLADGRIQEIDSSGSWLRSWDSDVLFSEPEVEATSGEVETLPDGTVFSRWTLRSSPDQHLIGYASLRTTDAGVLLSKLPEVLQEGPLAAVSSSNIQARGRGMLVAGDAHSVLGESPLEAWHISHFDNDALSAAPSSVITDATTTSLRLVRPDPTESALASRAVRELELPPGPYRFSVSGTQPVRLWVDGQLLIDGWLTPDALRRAEWISPGGWTWLRLEVQHADAGSDTALEWEAIPPTATSTTTPTDEPTSVPTATAMPTHEAQDRLLYLPIAWH